MAPGSAACGRNAPSASAARRDELRVCMAEACREEARRRDNAAKQRRYNARRSVGQAQAASAIDMVGGNNL